MWAKFVRTRATKSRDPVALADRARASVRSNFMNSNKLAGERYAAMLCCCNATLMLAMLASAPLRATDVIATLLPQAQIAIIAFPVCVRRTLARQRADCHRQAVSER
jgi:hypothetical protein